MAAVEGHEDHPPPYSPSDPSIASPPPLPARSIIHEPIHSSSTSLLPLQPIQSASDGRRKLLLIYIHGFMGNETSFQSFPVHVHNWVSALLSGSHAVNSKIYPKYRSKKSIELAVDDFSAWLAPHESPETDVILLGHSMGGLLTAEMVLRPAEPQAAEPLRHRIIGTIAFDTPYLGMHPGIIKSGIGSLFRPEPSPPVTPSNEVSTPAILAQDPNFNPPFFNDVQLPARTALKNAAHFLTKHSSHLRTATKQLIVSHIEFGQCLADFNGLKVRYCRIRILEEEDKSRRQGIVESATPPPRVRFVNYYTASTGRPKKSTPLDTENNEDTLNYPDTNNNDDVPRVPPASSVYEEGTEIESHSGPLDEKHPMPIAEDSDQESDLSDLTELDTLDDLESNFDDSMSVMDAPVDPSPMYDASHRDMPPPPFPGPVAAPYPMEKSQPLHEAPIHTSRASLPSYSADAPIAERIDHSHDQIAESSTPSEPEPPEPPGPTPSSTDYDDAQYYRAVLSDHGRMSQQYFADAKKHQTEQYDRFMKEHSAKIAGYHEEIRKLHELLVTETARGAKAIGEHATIMVEIQSEEVRSKIEHRQAIAQYQKLVAQDPSKAQQKYGKQQVKIDDKRAKLDRRLEKQREKVAKYQEKVASRAEKNARKLQKKGSEASSSIAESPLPNAAASTVEGADISYDLTTAPISRAVRGLGSLTASTTSLESTNSFLTPSTTTASSQLSLDNAYAEPMVLPSRTGTGTSFDAKSLASQPKKEKVFCVLPPTDAAGNQDPCWARVHMENVDEVGAHTGLFFARGAGEKIAPGQEWSERYTKLVCDVAERIEQWVGEDLSQRVARGLESR